jgi:hypothetical protein
MWNWKGQKKWKERGERNKMNNASAPALLDNGIRCWFSSEAGRG